MAAAAAATADPFLTANIVVLALDTQHTAVCRLNRAAAAFCTQKTHTQHTPTHRHLGNHKHTGMHHNLIMSVAVEWRRGRGL